MDAKIECPMGASDACQFNCGGTCIMNCSPCIGMTRAELGASKVDQFKECCSDVIESIPNTLDMLGEE